MTTKIRLLSALFVSSIACAAAAAPGDLDPAFGGTGSVMLQGGRSDNFPSAPALDPSDAKPIVGYGTTTQNGPGGGGVLRVNSNDHATDITWGYLGHATGGGAVTAVTTNAGMVYALVSAGMNVVHVARLTPSGALDLTWGTGGATAAFNGGAVPNEQNSQGAYAIAVGFDGKVVVGGFATGAGFNDEAMLVRFNANGTLDPGFGTGGILRFKPFGASTGHVIRALVVQPDGSIVAAGTATGPTIGFVVRASSTGVVDATYAGPGAHRVADGCTALTADGTGVVVGCSQGDFRVLRLDSAGFLDSGFNDTPKNAGGGSDKVHHVLRLPDGRFFVSGEGAAGSETRFAVMLLTSTGVLDTSFNGTGLYVAPETGYSYARGAVWDGSLIAVVGKREFGSSTEDLVFAKFSTTGVRVQNVYRRGSSHLHYFRAKAMSDGGLAAAGTTMENLGLNVNDIWAAVSRFTSTGAPMPGFGASGHAIANFDIGPVGIRDFAFLGDGKIVLTGHFDEHGTNETRVGVARMQSDGSFDFSFNPGGTPGYNYVDINPPGGLAVFFTRNLRVQSDGKLVATATSFSGTGERQMAVARFNSDGTLDTAYGSGGVARSAFTGSMTVRFVDLDLLDRAVVVADSVATNSLRLARFTTTGGLDTSFGSTGMVAHPLPAGFNVNLAAKVKVLPSGKVLVAFTARQGTVGKAALMRLNSDGSLDATFGAGGFAMATIAGTDYLVWEMAITPNGRIVLLAQTHDGNYYTAVLVRFNPNGFLDASFGSGGVRTYTQPYTNLLWNGLDVYADGALALAGDAGGSGAIYAHVAKTVADPSAVDPLPPPGDNFDERIVVPGAGATINANNTGFSREPGEPDHAGTFGGKSAWWSWTAPFSGTATITATPGSGGFDMLLAVYTGNAVNALIPIASADNGFGGDPEIVMFAVTAGTTYQIAVDGYNGQSGPFTLTLALAGGGQNDFNADGKPDIVWSNTANGATYVWHMNGPVLISDAFIAQIDPSWKVQGVADFNGDGKPDLVWRNNANGNTYVWYMNGANLVTDAFLFGLPPEWVIQGVTDFNADDKPDFLMRNVNSGVGFAWFFNDNVAIGDQFLFGIDPVWKVEQVGDVNADGQPDLLFRNMGSGLAFAWYTQYSGGNLSLGASTPPIFSIDPVWEVVQLEDWNGDNNRDLLFRNRDTGVVFVWYMTGTTLGGSDFIIQIDPVWEIVPRR